MAYELAAAGVGKLILAHGGDVRPSDLNRQILMTHDWIGRPRIESIVRRLRELNPHLETVGVSSNVTEENVESLVSQADLAHARAMADYLQIRAPFSAVVTQRNIDPGAYVKPPSGMAAAPLLQLINMDKMRLVLMLHLPLPESWTWEIRLRSPKYVARTIVGLAARLRDMLPHLNGIRA